MKVKVSGISVCAALMLWGTPALCQALGPGLRAPSPGVDASQALLVEPVAEIVVHKLPDGPLYWRVERFSSLVDAKRAAGPYSLAFETWGEFWLVSLGAVGASSPGGQKLAEMGPAPIPKATAYRLRINRASGAPGAKTPVHTHPGSEAFYVLKGQLTQRTPHGEVTLDAGGAMNGHQPGMAMQLFSSGAEELQQLVMFVVDANRPFSEPATFE